MAFKFENLKVWQRALDITREVDLLIKKFSGEEKYALASPIKRAGDSVALNIAEGSTGQSNKGFSKFLGHSLRSAIEIVGCLFLGKKRDVISKVFFGRSYQEMEEIIKMIAVLKNLLK